MKKNSIQVYHFLSYHVTVTIKECIELRTDSDHDSFQGFLVTLLSCTVQKVMFLSLK